MTTKTSLLQQQYFQLVVNGDEACRQANDAFWYKNN